MRIPYTFINDPDIRIVPGNFQGWQVQSRVDGKDDKWIDIPNGWFKDPNSAIASIARQD